MKGQIKNHRTGSLESISIRETKLFYVDANGRKYKKKNGLPPETKRGATHCFSLKLSSVA